MTHTKVRNFSMIHRFMSDRTIYKTNVNFLLFKRNNIILKDVYRQSSSTNCHNIIKSIKMTKRQMNEIVDYSLPITLEVCLNI